MQIYDEIILKDTFDYINEYQKQNGKSPSFRNILRAMPHHFTSVSKVDRYVKVLIERGLIGKESDGTISIAETLARGETVFVPLVGNCACGEPMFAEENVEETYRVPIGLLGRGDFFMLRAVGSSMKDAGIFNNDIMFVRKQNTAENGQIVIAMVEGSEATAKRFYKEGKQIRLHPENDDIVDGKKVYEDIIVRDCSILGIVTNVWHDVR